MSASTAPDSADHTSINAESQAKQQDTTVRIDLAGEPSDDHCSETIPTAGSPPYDAPFWINHAFLHTPRGLGPRTIRYISNKGSISEDWKHASTIRDAIWHKLDEILATGAAGDSLPSIVLDTSPISDDDGKGVLDLVFASDESFDEAYDKIVDGFDPIVLAGVEGEGETRTYKLQCSTNSLEGKVIPFECIRLPLDRLDGQAVLAAFREVFKALGSVLGISEVTITSERWDVEDRAAGVLRGYLELSPEWMTTEWDEAVSELPTHWVCNGFPYTLRYPGSDLHGEDVYSRDFTIPVADKTTQQSATPPSRKRAPATTERGESSSNAKKKAKRSKK